MTGGTDRLVPRRAAGHVEPVGRVWLIASPNGTYETDLTTFIPAPSVERTNARLRRFVSSGFCRTGDATKHAQELRRLGRLVHDEEHIKAKERFFKALADANRLRILKLLADREMCVCEVMVTLEMTQSNASHHLGILEREGLVRKRREGKWALYSLSSRKVASLIEMTSSAER